jgi:hypothetical protein
VQCSAPSNIDSLNDMGRLNVVNTSAKCGVVIVGNNATLAGAAGAEIELDESERTWKRLAGRRQVVEIETGAPQAGSRAGRVELRSAVGVSSWAHHWSASTECLNMAPSKRSEPTSGRRRHIGSKADERILRSQEQYPGQIRDPIHRAHGRRDDLLTNSLYPDCLVSTPNLS